MHQLVRHKTYFLPRRLEVSLYIRQYLVENHHRAAKSCHLDQMHTAEDTLTLNPNQSAIQRYALYQLFTNKRTKSIKIITGWYSSKQNMLTESVFKLNGIKYKNQVGPRDINQINETELRNIIFNLMKSSCTSGFVELIILNIG